MMYSRCLTVAERAPQFGDTVLETTCGYTIDYATRRFIPTTRRVGHARHEIRQGYRWPDGEVTYETRGARGASRIGLTCLRRDAVYLTRADGGTCAVPIDAAESDAPWLMAVTP